MTTVTCSKCNNTINSKHEYDHHVCGCDNQTWVCGNSYGGLNMKHVIQLVETKPEPEVPRLGTERPRRRTTRLSDVRIR